MFCLFIVLLSSNESLACDRTKCLFLNDAPCTFIPIHINMNPNELKYDLFMISLNKCNGDSNVLSPQECAQILKHLI